MVKTPPANAGDKRDIFRSLGWEYPLKKEMAFWHLGSRTRGHYFILREVTFSKKEYK